MGIYEKQLALKSFLATIDSSVTLKFDMSGRAKALLGRAYGATRTITIYRPCFKYTLDSLKACVLHELAHIYQYDINKSMNHGKSFGDIREMLLQDYGTPEIRAANTSRANYHSKYTIDNSVMWFG